MADREGEVTRVLKGVARTLDRGKYNEALGDLLRLSEKYPDAGEIRPQIAEVLIRRGESRARKGRLKEARGDFERSLSWTRTPGALVALARSAMAEGGLDRADELLNAALELDDRHGPTHAAIGSLFVKWQEYGEASRAFEQALALGYAAPSLYRQVWEAYMALERYDRAHELVLEGVERFPLSDTLQALAGDSFLYAKGDGDAARPYWEKAVELNALNFGALFNLAAEAAVKGARGRALDYLRRCAELDLDRARELWRQDMASPLRKFGEFARDPEFRRSLGWGND